jgi:hypothetical protein
VRRSRNTQYGGEDDGRVRHDRDLPSGDRRRLLGVPAAEFHCVDARQFAVANLYNPPGATDAQAAVDCGNSGMNLPAPSSTVESPISSDSLLSYYGKQLADSGWTAQGGHDQLVGSTWTRTNERGATVITTITVRPLPRNANCRETSMAVRTINKP